MLRMHKAMRLLPNPIDRQAGSGYSARNHGSFLFTTAAWEGQQMNRMIALHNQLAPTAGITLSALADVRLMRAEHTVTKAPAMYDPCISIVLQGRKRAQLGDVELIFDAQHYLVVAVPLPFSGTTEASPEEPFLALSINIDRT